MIVDTFEAFGSGDTMGEVGGRGGLGMRSADAFLGCFIGPSLLQM